MNNQITNQEQSSKQLRQLFGKADYLAKEKTIECNRLNKYENNYNHCQHHE